jgi:hypothetical protein
MLIQIQLSQVSSTMTGLNYKLMLNLLNIHNQTSEDQCQLTLIPIPHFLVSSIMTGLNYKLMPNLEGHQVQQVPLVQIMTLLQMIDSHKITSQFSKCQQLRRKLMLKMKKKLSLNKKTPMKLKKIKKLQLHQKEHHLF